MDPKISIQILNYNGKRFLKECIDSLLKQNYSNFEIVLVDNGSKDNSISFIEKEYKKEIKNKKIKIIIFKKNYGFAEGYNKAYKLNKNPYFLLLNNDVIIPNKEFLSNLYKTLKKENATLVGGLEHPINTKKFTRYRYYTTNILGFHTPGVISDINKSAYVGGSCLLVDVKKVDFLFPKNYFAYMEDVFLCWKSILQNKKVIYDPKANYLHHGSGTSQKGSPFTRYYSERNRLCNLICFYDSKLLFKIAPLFFLESLVKIIYLIKDPNLLKATLKAYFYILFNPSFILENKEKIKRTSNEELVSLMSHKIFPESKSKYLAPFLNKAVKLYCKIINIKTID